MTPIIRAQGLSLTHRLQLTSLLVERPQLIAVVGANGAGKTSLLRALAGIDAETGRVLVDGEEISHATPARRMRLLAILPATRSLIWPIAARDVIALGLPSADPNRVEELIAQLELRDLADRPVNQLSTGERTRVLLARALAAKPKMLLLDEPLSNLDPYWVLKTLEILRSEAQHAAVVASLHDLSQAAAFDRMLLVDDGRIIADGPPDKVLKAPELSKAFRIERAGAGWRISERA